MAPIIRFVTYLLQLSVAVSFSTFYSLWSSKQIENTALIFLAYTLKWDCQWPCSTAGMFALPLPAMFCGLDFFFLIKSPNKYGFQIVKCFSQCVIKMNIFLLGFFESFVLLFLESHFLFTLCHLGDIQTYWKIFCVFEFLCHVNHFNYLKDIIAIYRSFFSYNLCYTISPYSLVKQSSYPAHHWTLPYFLIKPLL